jgi:hypothetical protein
MLVGLFQWIESSENLPFAVAIAWEGVLEELVSCWRLSGLQIVLAL